MPDFNDVYKKDGSETVRLQIESARPVMDTAQPDAHQGVNAAGGIAEQGPGKKDFPLRSGRDLRALDIKIEWIIDGLVPRGSVVLLYGRGGIGKTTLMMMLANATDRGETIFGMATVKTQVIIVDFENSLAVLSERAKRTAVDGVQFWDSGHNSISNSNV